MWKINPKHIAGIKSGELTLSPGTNCIQASNFSGKSSLIKSIKTVAGATGQYSAHPLTENQDEGEVKLETADGEYTVTLERDNSDTVISGDPYLSDEFAQHCAALFAFLGEENPIRSAVRNGEDFTKHLHKPLDIENIDSKIESLKSEKRTLAQNISEIEDIQPQIPPLEKKIDELEEDIKTLRKKRRDVEEKHSEKTQRDSLSDELSERRSDLENIESQIQHLQNQIERKQGKIESKREELDSIDVPDEDLDQIKIESKKDRIADLEWKISLIDDVYRATRNIISNDEYGLLADINRGIAGDDLTCWTCGNNTTKRDLEDNVEQTKSKLDDLREEKSEIQSSINDHEKKREKINNKRESKQKLQEEIDTIRASVEDLEAQLDSLSSQKEEIEEDIDEIEDQIESSDEDYSDEIADIKTKIRIKKQEKDNKQSKLEDYTDRVESLDELRDQFEEIENEIEDLREKKTETQYDIKETFEEEIGNIVELFDPGFENARLDVKTNPEGEIENFELKIARQGQVTTIDALSESEVELIGIVVALAGYRVFDVGDYIPILVLDGISQLDATHLQKLVSYVEDETEILVTTAFPEVEELTGEAISPTNWHLVSDEAKNIKKN